MGRWFIINEVSPKLKTGVTLAIFILSGKVPFLRDKSEIHFNGTNKEFCHPLRRKMLFLFLHFFISTSSKELQIFKIHLR